ncbi:MAG: zinc ribbon domain-containing protein [Lachnospiraceae bacterium]|nr:zinc ribbon domain-containing protein [Lachnospiraceae bacterium]
MDLFDKISDTIFETGKTITNKAKETSDTAKLNYELHQAEKKLTDAFKGLGQAYYEEYKSDEDAEFQVQMYEIKELKKKIKNLEKEIQSVRGTMICPNCGAELPKDAKFCLKCGEKIDPFTED